MKMEFIYRALHLLQYLSLYLCINFVCTTGSFTTALTINQLHPGGQVHLGDSLLLLCKYSSVNEQNKGSSPVESNSTKSVEDDKECQMIWTLAPDTKSQSHTLPPDVTVMFFKEDSSSTQGEGDEVQDDDTTKDNMVLSLYVEKTTSKHAGLYTCNLDCPGLSLSDSKQIQFADSHLEKKLLEETTEEPSKEIDDSGYTSVIMEEIRMAIAMVLVLIIVGLFGLMCWAKSSIAKAGQRKKQNPPTYKDVIKNPDKYPMTVSSASGHARDQCESEDVEARVTETEILEQPGTRPLPQQPQTMESDLGDILRVEFHSD